MDYKMQDVDGFDCVSQQCELYFVYAVVTAIDKRTGEEQPLELFFQMIGDPEDKTSVSSRVRNILHEMGYMYLTMTDYFSSKIVVDAQEYYLRGVDQTAKEKRG